MTPVDVIRQTINKNVMAPMTQLAEAVAQSLTHNEVIASAVQALKDDGWEETHDGGTLSGEDLSNIARVVLRSVGGA